MFLSCPLPNKITPDLVTVCSEDAATPGFVKFNPQKTFSRGVGLRFSRVVAMQPRFLYHAVTP